MYSLPYKNKKQRKFKNQKNSSVSPTTTMKNSAVNDPNLFEFTKIQEYIKMNKLLINSTKMANIEKKLELQHKVNKNYTQRANKNDYYFKFNYNPFSQTGYIPKESKSLNLVEKKEKSQDYSPQKIQNIVNVMSNVFHGKKLNYNFDIRRKLKQFQRFSKKTNNILKEHQYKLHLETEKKLKNKQKQKVEKQNKFIANLKEEIIQFDKIAALKQDSYFKDKLTTFNIHKLLFDQNYLKSGKQHLKSFYFCKDSLIERTSELKIPFERHISTESRQLVFKKKGFTNEQLIQKIPTSTLNPNFNKLSFDNLAVISSGQMSSTYLYSFINGQFNYKRKNSEIENENEQIEKEIYYGENRNHHQNNFVDKDNHRKQKQILQSQDLYPKQKAEVQRCLTLKDEFQLKIKHKLNLKSKQIKDAKEHQKINIEKNYILSNIFMKKPQRHIKSIDRMIRQNKMVKDKKERLSTNILLSTIIMKKAYDKKSTSRSAKSNNEPNKQL